MRYSVHWAPQSLRDIRKLNKQTVNRLTDGVNRLASQGYGDVKKLTGPHAEYRLRIGDWRVRFTLDDGIKVLSVLRVLPRGEAYKNM